MTLDLVQQAGNNDAMDTAMITGINATVVNGTLQFDLPLQLPEQTRVQVTVQPVKEQQISAKNALERLRKRIVKNPVFLGTEKYSREELNERN